MAEKTPQDEIMALVPMKQALGLAERKPLGCALALTKDRKDVLVLIDRKMKPKKVADQLKKDAKAIFEPSTLRFGRVSFDVENDPGTVRFNLHKSEPGGMLMHTVKLMKRAGYQAAVFNVNEDLENEEAEGGESEGEESATLPQGQATGSVPPAPPPPPKLNAAQISSTFARLAPGIKAAMATHPELSDALQAAAASVVGLLKAEDLSGAAHSLEDLIRLLKQAAPTGTGAAQPPDPAYKQARTAWEAAIEAVDAQIEKLAAGLRATGVPVLQEIAEFGLNGVTAGFKVPLMAALMDVGAGTPETLAKSGPKALAAVRAFKQHISGDARVAACDDNPLDIPVSVRTTLTPALTQLETALAAKPA